MATRSMIGYLDGGKAVATYCHWDGDPNTKIGQIESIAGFHGGMDGFKSLIEQGKGGISAIDRFARIELLGSGRHKHEDNRITADSLEDLIPKCSWDIEYVYLLKVDDFGGLHIEWHDIRKDESFITEVNGSTERTA